MAALYTFNLHNYLLNFSYVPKVLSARHFTFDRIQESACLQLYHTAIRYQQDGQLEQARALYREVLESEVMDEVITS